MKYLTQGKQKYNFRTRCPKVRKRNFRTQCPKVRKNNFRTLCPKVDLKKKGNRDMAFFTATVTGLKVVVTAVGCGFGVWGVINLLEGYGSESGASKSQGVKQLMAGGGIVIIAQTVIPQLTTLFS